MSNSFGRIGCAAVLFAAAATLLASAPGRALDVDSPTNHAENHFVDAVRKAYWQGRTCSSPACAAPRPGSVVDVASFAVAAFGGVLLSRRRGR